jgi:predicted DNA-binding transcriptional regulator YafY
MSTNWPPFPADIVTIDYTNHEGERRERKIKPVRIWFGETEFHKGRQWFLHAYDHEKREYRDFAMKDIWTGAWRSS